MYSGGEEEEVERDEERNRHKRDDVRALCEEMEALLREGKFVLGLEALRELCGRDRRNKGWHIWGRKERKRKKL